MNKFNNARDVRTQKEDKLDRYPFAQNIVSNILNSKYDKSESITIGINGEWGSGKTSLINFIKAELDKQKSKNDFIIDFKPWIYSNNEDLQLQFLRQLRDETLSITLKLKSHTKQLIKSFAKGLSGLKTFEPTTQLGLNSISNVIQYFIDEEAHSLTIKKVIDSYLIENNIFLYIFIDDVDRLNSKEICDLFQLIKTNVDFKNTFFIISYDRNVVVQGLEKEYSNHAAKYLDKIIQVDYNLPMPLPEKIEEIFSKELYSFLDKNNLEKLNFDDFDRLWYVINPFFTNVRDVYRYINSISLSFFSIKDDIIIMELLVLEVLRVFRYETYESLNREYRKFKIYINSSDKSKIDIQFEKDTEMCLKFLLESRLNHFDNDGIHSFRNENYYNRYFSLLLPKRQISDSELKSFLENDSKEDRIEFLKKFRKENRLDDFRPKFLRILNETTIYNFDNLLDIIFEFGCEDKNQKIKTNSNFIDNIIRLYFEKTDYDFIKVINKITINYTENEFNIVNFYYLLFYDYVKPNIVISVLNHNKFKDIQLKISDRLKTDYKLWHNKLLEIQDEKLFLDIFINFEKYSTPEQHKIAFEKMISNSRQLKFFLDAITARENEDYLQKWSTLIPKDIEIYKKVYKIMDDAQIEQHYNLLTRIQREIQMFDTE